MIRYFVRRLGALLPVAIGVATLTFAMIHLVPGDPVVAMLGETAAPADIEGMRHSLAWIGRSDAVPALCCRTRQRRFR